MQKSFRSVDLGFSFGTIGNLTEDAIILAKVLEPHGVEYVTFEFSGKKVMVNSQTRVSDANEVLEAVMDKSSNKLINITR